MCSSPLRGRLEQSVASIPDFNATRLMFVPIISPGPYHGLRGGAARGAGGQVVRRGARAWGRTLIARQVTGCH